MKKSLLALALGLAATAGFILNTFAVDLPQNFATKTAKVTMLEFSAPWCLSCQKMKPEVEKLEKEMGAKLHIVYINVDKSESEKYVDQFKVESAPTFILFNNKGKQVNRVERDITFAELKSMINKAMTQ